MTQQKSIQEELIDAEAAEEPGNLKPGTVLGSSNGITMTASELQSAGYVYVYDNRTGDRSVVNRNMLEQQLNKTREDGSYIFTTQKPPFERVYGTVKCILHKDDPTGKPTTGWDLPCVRKTTLPQRTISEYIWKRGTLENGQL